MSDRFEIIKEPGFRKLVLDSGWLGKVRRWSTWLALSVSWTGLSFGVSLTWHRGNYRLMAGLGMFFAEWHLTVLPPDPETVGDEDEDAEAA